MDFRRIYFLFVTGFCLIFFSCESEESCEQSTVSALNAGFYSIQDSLPEAASVDGFTVYGIGRADSLIYDQANSISSFDLPLSSSCDTTGFVFTLGADTDTIRFLYSRELHLLSIECGFTTYYYIERIDNIKDMYEQVISFIDIISNGENNNE